MKRTAWKQQWDTCWVCGAKPWTGLDCHEIIAGRGAANCPACWTCLCRLCHEKVQSQPRFYAVLLALKKLHDEQNYDREKVATLRGRAATSVTEDEVRAAMAAIELLRL